MGFGLEGKNVADVIRHLATFHRNPTSLEMITTATTSCIQWGGILQELMQKDSIQTLFLWGHESFDFPQIEQIREELRAGKAVLVSLKLQDCDRRAFCIESRAGGRQARILHGWRDALAVQAERTMPVEEMTSYLIRLWSSDLVADRKELQNAFEQLFGADRAQLNSNAIPGIQSVSFEAVIRGMLKQPLDAIGTRQRLYRLFTGMSDWQSVVRRSGTAIEPELGFVFGLGGIMITTEHDLTEEALPATKMALGKVAGGVASVLAGRLLTPTFASIGSVVVRANILSGVAFTSVFALWDVVEWQMHKITEVQLRQRMAEGLAGAAGGIGGGVAAGLGFGLWLGPMGAAVGALVGGIVGGVGGAFAGKAIDGAIWDASEDSVMNMYEFFGWHNVKRNTRPVKTAKEMEKAYDKKLQSKPPKMKVTDWDQICQASVVVLLQAMYPAFKEVMKMADNLQKNRSGAVSAIGTAMYQSIIRE